MNESNLSLDEMREIFLYHYLNKQLIDLSGGSNDITDDCHKTLQDFSLGNNLFQKVTDDPIIHDIPLSLEIDFQKTCFVTINSESWNELLGHLIKDVITLDIEHAIADTFVALTKFDRGQSSYKDRKKEVDDSQLHAFIRRYLDLRESQGRNLSFMATDLHQIKCDVLKNIMEIDQSAIQTRTIDDTLQIDFSRSDKKKMIAVTYVEKFCMEALNIIQFPTVPLIYDLNLFGFLQAAQDEGGQAASIKEFVENELAICERETELLDNFISDVQGKINAGSFEVISVCSTAPFYYLKNPFPLA